MTKQKTFFIVGIELINYLGTHIYLQLRYITPIFLVSVTSAIRFTKISIKYSTPCSIIIFFEKFGLDAWCEVDIEVKYGFIYRWR